MLFIPSNIAAYDAFSHILYSRSKSRERTVINCLPSGEQNALQSVIYTEFK